MELTYTHEAGVGKFLEVEECFFTQFAIFLAFVDSGRRDDWYSHSVAHEDDDVFGLPAVSSSGYCFPDVVFH